MSKGLLDWKAFRAWQKNDEEYMPKSVKGVMDEWKAGELHSGSKKGPVVKNQKQAVAIALSEQRQRGKSVPKGKKK